MPSDLRARLDSLVDAIVGGPDRLSAFRMMPFAIFVYAPREEFELREELQKIGQRLSDEKLDPRVISLAQLAYESVERAQAEDGGWDVIYAGERKKRSCKAAVQTVQRALTEDAPLSDLVIEKLADADPQKTIVFLSRIGALYPAYRSHALLASLAGRLCVPAILLYPGRRTPDGGLEYLEELPADTSTYARIF